MGQKKDKALNRKVHNKDIERIDELAFILKNGTKQERYKAQAEILNYFDAYLEKYTNLLTGVSVDLSNYDTRGFLAMFLTGRPKTAETFSHQTSYIVKVLKKFSRDDIKAELITLFLTVLSKYRIVTGVNALNPLTKIFKWRVKDWFNRVVKDPLFKTVEPNNNNEEDNFSLESFIDSHHYYEPDFEEMAAKLDLNWVLEPRQPIYQVLTRYERYLLSLIYQQKFGINEAADKLHRDKDTVKRHLKIALKKLEDRFLNAGEERDI